MDDQGERLEKEGEGSCLRVPSMRDFLASGELDEILHGKRQPVLALSGVTAARKPRNMLSKLADNSSPGPGSHPSNRREIGLSSTADEYELITPSSCHPSRTRSFVYKLRQRALSLKLDFRSGRKDRRASEPCSRRTSIPDRETRFTPLFTSSTTSIIEIPGTSPVYLSANSTSTEVSSSSPSTTVTSSSPSSPLELSCSQQYQDGFGKFPHVSRGQILNHAGSRLSQSRSPSVGNGILPERRLTQSFPLQSSVLEKMADLDKLARQSSAFLDPAAISRHQQLTAQKARTTNIAQEEEAYIRGRLRKKNLEHTFPQYRFVDFIGKGTYGRVFHALDLTRKPPRDVAVKLMNLDDVDYKANGVEKDETLKDVKNEISILMQLKDARARNVNLIYDVLEVDGFLWIICEHCPGGSLRTLLRASQNKCEEQYIRIVARELALGLAAIHGANVIHRDLKAANVMIHEQGSLQIIDFGVAGAVESKTDKRMTFIGTPYWMAPEQHVAKGDAKYGFEVDVWAYAITLYEIATGAPPHVQLPPNRLAQGLRRNPPRLSQEKFSKELCEFFEFVAQVDAQDRPSTQDILDHPYLRDSEKTFPTRMLKDLVDKFLDWSLLGGQRTSLFLGSGAKSAAELTAGNKADDIDFIFSTSRDLTDEYTPEHDLNLASSPPGTMLVPSLQINSPSVTLEKTASDGTEKESRSPRSDIYRLSEESQATKERRIARGGQALEALFDASQDPYEYNVRSADMVLDRPILSRAKSDLPLRNNDTSASPVARKEVDYSDASSSSKSDVELADADTIKQKRKQPKRDTMGWQPDWGAVEESMGLEAQVEQEPQPLTLVVPRPPLLHAETAPGAVAQARASIATLDLDDMMGDDDWIASSAMGSSFTALPSAIQRDPEDEDITVTRRSFDHHKDDSFDAYASSLADISASEDEASAPALNPYHSRDYPPATSGLSSSSADRQSSQHPSIYTEIEPPNPAVMADGAPAEMVEAEVTRLLSGFVSELSALAAEFPHENDFESDIDTTQSDLEDYTISAKMNGAPGS